VGIDCEGGRETEKMSIVGVTMAAPDLDAAVDTRFGRAPYVLLVDRETMGWEAVENPAHDAGSGAGVGAAELLTERHVKAVVSGEFGPNAHATLRAAKIPMYYCREGMTGREAIERLKRGELESLSGAARVGEEEAGAGTGAGGIGNLVGGIVGGLVTGRGLGRGEGGGRSVGGGRGWGGGGGGRGRGPGGGGGRGRGGGGRGRGRGGGRGGGGRGRGRES
jgi:predicted Fe-Mo cluster-binding NifX family protein